MNNQDGAQILLNLCGVFGRHKFFTDKLIKDGFEVSDADYDEWIINW